MEPIFTIGYEGAELAPFIATLKKSGVKHVSDIRDVPPSRERGRKLARSGSGELAEPHS